jgi:hypothetical protein
MEIKKITRVFTGIFTGKKNGNPHKRYPDEYCERYWLNKVSVSAIKMVAFTTGSSKKHAGDYLIEQGVIRHYVNLFLQDRAEREAAEKRGEKYKADRVMRLFIKTAKENGIDITKFI